jgi:hypothetical protein
MADGDAQIVRIVGVRRAPDRRQDLLMGDEATGMAHQERQDVELLARQLGLGAVDRHHPPRQIDTQAARRQHRLLRRRRLAIAQQRAQPGHQLAGGEGLGDVVVGAGVEGGDLLALGVAGGEDENG